MVPEARPGDRRRGLSALVRRPFRGVGETSESSPATSGEGELSRLEEAPADHPRAQALGEALAARAAADSGFRSDLGQWHEPAMTLRVGEGRTTNHIRGGTFHGPAVLAENISGGLTFTTPPPATLHHRTVREIVLRIPSEEPGHP